MLRTPEARLHRSSWADGSLDLAAGLGLAIIGLGYLLDLVVTTAIAPPLALTAWLVLRSRVVEPRTGRAEPRAVRRARSTRELVLTAAVGVAALLLALAGVLAVRADVLELGDAVDALPAVLTALLALAAAALTRSPRFAGYAGLLLAGGVLTVVLGAGPGWPLVIAGAAAAATGGVLLARLLAETASEPEDAREADA